MGHRKPCVSPALTQAHTSGHLSLTPQRRVKKLAFLLLWLLVSSPHGSMGASRGGELSLLPRFALCLLSSRSPPLSSLRLSSPFPPWLSPTPPSPFFPSLPQLPLGPCCPSLPRTVSLCLSLPSQPPELANSCSLGGVKTELAAEALWPSQEPGWGLFYVQGGGGGGEWQCPREERSQGELWGRGRSALGGARGL